MENLMNEILAGTVSTVMTICIEVCGWILGFIDKVGLDPDYIESLFGVLKHIGSAFTDIGYAVSFLIFVFSLFQFLFPYSDIDMNTTNPFTAIFRFGMSTLFVYGFKDVLVGVYDNFIVGIFDGLSTDLTAYNNASYASNISNTSIGEYFGSVWGTFDITGFTLPLKLVVLIFFLVLVINCVKFVMFHFEKLFMTQFLLYVAPAACGTLASKKTGQIFKNYINLLLSNMFCLIFNLIISKVVVNGLINLTPSSLEASSGDDDGGFARNFIIGILLITSVLKVGKKMSVYVGSLFNINGMSDSIKDGIGGLMTAAGVVFAGSRLGKSIYSHTNAGKNAAAAKAVDMQTRINEAQANNESYQGARQNLEQVQNNLDANNPDLQNSKAEEQAASIEAQNNNQRLQGANMNKKILDAQNNAGNAEYLAAKTDEQSAILNTQANSDNYQQASLSNETAGAKLQASTAGDNLREYQATSSIQQNAVINSIMSGDERIAQEARAANINAETKMLNDKAANEQYKQAYNGLQQSIKDSKVPKPQSITSSEHPEYNKRFTSPEHFSGGHTVVNGQNNQTLNAGHANVKGNASAKPSGTSKVTPRRKHRTSRN